MSRSPNELDDLKRSIGMHQLLELAEREGLRHRGSGRNRSECPGCRNGDPRGASIGERDGVGVWNCHRDEQHGGTGIDFLVFSRSISIAAAIRELQGTIGAASRPTQQRSPPSPPPPAEVAALWQACRPISLDGEIADAWAARGIEVGHVEDRDLARVLPRGTACPAWAAFRGQPWSAGRHRLVVPIYDATGKVRSLHARAVSAFAGVPKGLSPAGYAVGGLVMADQLTRLLLAGQDVADGTAAEAVRQYGLVICEGVPDFLTWATRWGDAAETAPGVLGVISGSWSNPIAARIASGTRVYVRAHGDAAGGKYSSAIVASLDARCLISVTIDDGG